MLIDHLDKLRSRPQFKASHIRLILESNYAWVRSKDIYHAVRSYQRYATNNVAVLCTREKDGGKTMKRIGFWLGHDAEDKLRLATHFQTILHTGKLLIYDQFVSQNKNIFDILRNQMSSFELIPRPTQVRNDLAPPRFEVSGKRGGKKDDVMMSLIEIAYYSALIWYEPELCKPFGAKRLWTIERFANSAPDLYRREVDTLYVR